MGAGDDPVQDFRPGQTDHGIAMNELPEIDTIEYYINALADMYGDKTAFVWKGSYRTQSLSYLEVQNLARRLVMLLESLRIEKGDKVCVWAPNSPSWPVFFFGCLLSGIVVVPVDFSSRAAMARVIIEKVGAKAILLSKLKDVDIPIPKLYTEELLEKLAAFQPVLPSHLPPVQADDQVEIIFTSGTTSDPKGVIITHKNLISNIRSLRYMMPLDPGYRFLSLLPLSHLFEQVLGLFYPLRFGGSILYTSTRKSSAIKRLLKKRKITALVCVPFFLDSLKDSVVSAASKKGMLWSLQLLMAISARLPFSVRRALSYPFRRAIDSQLKSFICGGSKLSEATEDFWMALGIRVIQGYGLTEAAPVVSCNAIRQYKAHTVGKLLPGQKLRIMDDGEILIHGTNVTPGYYQNDEATKAAFDNEWYKTGDIGELDSDGYLVIKGRKKEIILTSSGLNIFPQDVESALNDLPSVRESCVVGLEKDGKTRIFAAVIPEPSCMETIEQIIQEANAKLNPNQRIQEGCFWPEKSFPMTQTLKTKKHEVIRVLEKRQIPAKKETLRLGLADKESSDLPEMLADYLHCSARQIGAHSKLRSDLGLDSLGIVELVVRLEERYNIDFDESNLGPDTTVADLQTLIDTFSKSARKFPAVSWARSPLAVWVRCGLQALLNMNLRALFHLEIYQQDLLKSLTLPVILVANHTSHLDSPVILKSLPFAMRRRTAVAAAADYFFGLDASRDEKGRVVRKILPIFAPLVLNAFPLCRRGSIRKSLELLGEVLDDGWSVILYPEGTRSPTGEMGAFKPGIGLIAAEMAVPVVPVKLDGLHAILPKGKVIPRMGRSKVVFGKPLVFKGERDYAATARKIEDALRSL